MGEVILPHLKLENVDHANGTNLTEALQDLISSSLSLQITLGLVYLVIFFLGVFGNVLVCYVVIRNRQMQTVTNLFITNLALSDVLLCLLGVPFTPLYTFLGSWIFGDILCHLVPYAQGVSIYISTLTLTSIAIDRFLVILYPFRPRMKITTCLGIILAIWLVALLLTLPYGWFVKPQEFEDSDMKVCNEAWPSDSFKKSFSSTTSILQFVIPFTVIAFCYVCVSMRLKTRLRMKPGSKTTRREEIDRERKRKTNRMLIAMVAIFGVSWLPLNLFNVMDDFYPHPMDVTYFFLAHCLAMSSTCYNPFLYAWLNDNFRKEFKQVLPCFSRPGSLHRDPETGWRSDRTGNGGFLEQTVQESLLPSFQFDKKHSSGCCEMISLEPICSNLT